MLWRVLATLKPGGVGLITGIEPFEMDLESEHGPRRGGSAAEKAADRTLLEVEALGDAAALLALGRSYRELPRAWVLRELRRGGGASGGSVSVLATSTFSTSLTGEYLRSQLRFARKEAARVADSELRQALLARATRLEPTARAFALHRRTRLYAIVVQRRA